MNLKFLPLLVLAALLGAGIVYFLLSSGDTGRGSRDGAREPRATSVASEPGPASDERADDDEPAAEERSASRPGAPGGVQRESVDVAPAPDLRTTYEGTIIGEDAPLPGAKVALLRRDEPLGEVDSDERGRFRLAIPVQHEAVLLVVRARGYVPIERKLLAKLGGGTELLANIRLTRGVLVAGRVLDGRGIGVADAEISIEPVHAGGDLLRARGRTGSDGRFEVPESPSGSVLVRVRARGFGEKSVDHVASREKPQPLDIQLDPGSRLAVRLVTPRGEAVQGADVTITAAVDARVPPRTEKSDEHGNVIFEGLGANSWNVRIAHPAYRPTGKSQVRTDGAEPVTFSCTPWPAIEGMVRAPGGGPPPRGTRVLALPAAAPGDRMVGTTGGEEVEPDGRFRLSGLRQGDWSVRVSAPGFAPSSSPPIKLGIEGDGFAGTIELQAAGTLLLRLTSEGEPLGGAQVELSATKPTPAQLWALQSARSPTFGKRARSGTDGLVEFDELAAGETFALVFADGSPPSIAGPYSVTVGTRAQPRTYEVPRGARIRGRVSRAAGGPFPNAQLRVVERDGRLGFPQTLAADGEGRYTTDWLPAGHYTVEAFDPAGSGQRSGATELDLVPGDERELDLSL